MNAAVAMSDSRLPDLQSFIDMMDDGLLLCDAERRTEHRVLPPPGERWSAPVARHANGRLQVCASADAERARHPAWTAVV